MMMIVIINSLLAEARHGPAAHGGGRLYYSQCVYIYIYIHTYVCIHTHSVQYSVLYYSIAYYSIWYHIISYYGLAHGDSRQRGVDHEADALLHGRSEEEAAERLAVDGELAGLLLDEQKERLRAPEEDEGVRQAHENRHRLQRNKYYHYYYYYYY